jgi:diacylglycerol kinase (ATP)
MMRFFKGFIYAFNGIRLSLKSGGNFLFHLFAAIVVISLGFYLKISNNEWIAIVICIAFVLAAETFNTAIEKLTDIISPNYNKNAGEVKDLAAGAVLICAIGAAITGLIIFIPYLF